jgi:hypothetical protein
MCIDLCSLQGTDRRRLVVHNFAVGLVHVHCLLTGHEIVSRHVKWLAFFSLREAVAQKAVKLLEEQAASRPVSRAVTVSTPSIPDLGNVRPAIHALANQSMHDMCQSNSQLWHCLCPQSRRRIPIRVSVETPGSAAMRAMQVWPPESHATVKAGFRFADSNDDAMFTSGVVFWEKNLLRFRRKIQPFTEFEQQKARELMGADFVLPPLPAGLLDGACVGINEALVSIMESLQLLVPFIPVRTVARKCCNEWCGD